MRLRFDKNKIHPEFFYTFFRLKVENKDLCKKLGKLPFSCIRPTNPIFPSRYC